MSEVKKRLYNQAIGLSPLLLFMFLNYYFSYWLSFIIGVSFCLICVVLFWILSRDKVYLFILLPSAFTFVLYSLCMCLRLEPMLYAYSPLVAELLFVVTLTVTGFTKRAVLRRVRNSGRHASRRASLRATLNEFYFLAQLLQNLYTLHLFAILFYGMLPDTMRNMRVARFLYLDLGWIIGVLVIIYEQIRVSLMRGSLKKEMWLPVLNDKGKVIGCIARSVSRSLPKKYFHPIVRVVILFNGMLYLTKRSKEEFVSPETVDYPMHNYILFRRSVESTLKETLGILSRDKSLTLRFLVRYTFENEKVKHLVSLYVVRLRTEEQLLRCKRRSGKLWTPKQIEENLKAGIFSEYFEKEFPYLKSTILLAENF